MTESARLFRPAFFSRALLARVAVALVLLGRAGFAWAEPGALVRLADGGSTATLNVPVGDTRSLKTTTSYVDLVVGDPDIADAMPLTDRSFYIHGKKIGETTISAYDAQKALVGTLEVEVGADLSRLNADLRRQLPGSQIRASSINGHIMLSGVAADAVSVGQAMTMASEFGPDPVNTMTVAQPQEVMLEVRFIEVSRNAGRQLGVSWNVATRHFSATLGAAVSNNPPFGTILQNILSSGVTADVAISALEQQGMARRLAEPNLIAMSGQTASFLAGGEFPFPVEGSNNTVYVTFKKYGVGLSFTPTVLSDGTINLKIAPEVSELDTTNTVSSAGVTVPSLVVRRVSTDVELKDGQSFAIAGLLQDQLSQNASQFPWLGQVPVLGALFRDTAFTKNETDLAVIVTPHLVQPARPGQNLRTPFDSSAPGNDVDQFLLGRNEVSASERRRSRGQAPQVAFGHILEIDSGADRGGQD